MAQRLFDHLEVDDLEDCLDLVPDLGAAISGSYLALASGDCASTSRGTAVTPD